MGKSHSEEKEVSAQQVQDEEQGDNHIACSISHALVPWALWSLGITPGVGAHQLEGCLANWPCSLAADCTHACHIQLVLQDNQGNKEGT